MELHWSNLNTLMKCGVLWEFIDTCGPRPPRSAMIVGSSLHDTTELDLTCKMETGILLPEDVVTDAARDAVVGRVDREGLSLQADEAFFGRAVTIDAMKDQAVGLAVLHHEKAAPLIEPIALERSWILDFSDTGHTLAGRIDVEEVRGIIDPKTVSKAPTQKWADTSDQLTMYTIAKSTLDGIPPEEIELRFDCLHKLKTPKYKPFPTRRTQKDVDALLLKIQTALRVIETGVFMPTSRENWWCSPEWCAFYDDCPYTG